MKRFGIIVATLLCVSVTCFCQQQSWVELEKILGRKGTVQGDVCKFAFPRSDLKVKVGDLVKPGDQLLILEAMKMENILKSQGEGTVRNVKVKKGDTVEKGQVLVEF